MHRVFLQNWKSGINSICGDEVRHLTLVLRLKKGDVVEVFDGLGSCAQAEVKSISRDCVDVFIFDMTSKISNPYCCITLAQAIPKGKNMDLIVQKSVELGVARIVPLVTRNTIVQPGEGKADKWRRVALEACKQSGQNILPEICEPESFSSWISASAPLEGSKIIASLLPSARSLRSVIHDSIHSPVSRYTVLIGPEGDFTNDESQLAMAYGFSPASLGANILRVETAALYCLCAINYEFNYLKNDF